MTEQGAMFDSIGRVTDMGHARSARDAGMQQALDHAEAVVYEWGDLAFAFLENFIRGRMYFISEDVSDAFKAAGHEQPPTDRAWGSIYIRARKAGWIVQDGCGRSRRRHASICPRWKSLLFHPPPHAA